MDTSTANPGPLDPSVLYDQEKHVSAAVWEGQVIALLIVYFMFLKQNCNEYD